MSHTLTQECRAKALSVECLSYNGLHKNSLKIWLVDGEGKMVHHKPLAQHATRWCVHMCACVKTPPWWRPVSDRKANWQAQTHRSGESMGPARAYLLPMMKPNTMNTRMMVPATATTAMMMTGFCSLETIAADERHTQTDRQRCSVWTSQHWKLQSAWQTVIKSQWTAWRLITIPPPTLTFSPLRENWNKGFSISVVLIHTALLFQKVGLIVPGGDSNVLHLKQRHIQVELFPIQSSHSSLTVCTDKLLIAPKKQLEAASYTLNSTCVRGEVHAF